MSKREQMLVEMQEIELKLLGLKATLAEMKRAWVEDGEACDYKVRVRKEAERAKLAFQLGLLRKEYATVKNDDLAEGEHKFNIAICRYLEANELGHVIDEVEASLGVV